MIKIDYLAIRFLSKKHLLEAIEQIFTEDKMIRAKDVELIFEKFGDYYDLETQTIQSGYNEWSDLKPITEAIKEPKHSNDNLV